VQLPGKPERDHEGNLLCAGRGHPARALVDTLNGCWTIDARTARSRIPRVGPPFDSCSATKYLKCPTITPRVVGNPSLTGLGKGCPSSDHNRQCGEAGPHLTVS
jgi:hypothetical protein